MVDDNSTRLGLYELVLSNDFVVIHATRGTDGFDSACEQQPDAIVMDVLLPDIDGLEVSRRIRANPVHHAHSDSRLDGRRRGVCSRPSDAARTDRCPDETVFR
jgi:CheY-like chemotaxis protein